MERGGTIYIMTNYSNTTLYVGVTSDLISRVFEHRHHKYPRSFTARYNIHKLVYFEVFNCIEEAIAREKQIKGGSRKKKLDLIGSKNPNWVDLWQEIQNW